MAINPNIGSFIEELLLRTRNLKFIPQASCDWKGMSNHNFGGSLMLGYGYGFPHEKISIGASPHCLQIVSEWWSIRKRLFMILYLPFYIRIHVKIYHTRTLQCTTPRGVPVKHPHMGRKVLVHRFCGYCYNA